MKTKPKKIEKKNRAGRPAVAGASLGDVVAGAPEPARVESQDPSPAVSEAPASPPGDGPRKAGRPKGARNLPKAVDLPRARRKGPEELKDTRAGIEGLTSDLEKVIERHNREHGTRLKAPKAAEIFESTGAAAPTAKISPQDCTMGMAVVVEAAGRLMHVESRPTPEELAEAGKRLSALSAYLKEVDPVWVAAGAAVLACGSCFAPLVIEKLTGEPVKRPDDGSSSPPVPVAGSVEVL